VGHFGFASPGFRVARVRFVGVLLRSKIAVIGAGFYLLAFVCTCVYSMFDHRTFSGLIVVLFAWPWIDYLPSASLLVAVALNAIIIYVFLAVLPRVPGLTSPVAKVKLKLTLT
jgi:hypothetical protein